MNNQKPRMTDEELMQTARRRVAMKKAFQIHLMVYISVNLFLVAVFFITSRNNWQNYFWPMWPMMGWGLGLAIHGAVVYSNVFASGNDQVMKEYQKLKDANQYDQDQ